MWSESSSICVILNPTGEVMVNELFTAYLAGFFDGEGSAYVRKNTYYVHSQSGNDRVQRHRYTIMAIMENLVPDPIIATYLNYGGTLCDVQPVNLNANRSYRLSFHTKGAYNFLQGIHPYLIRKHQNVTDILKVKDHQEYMDAIYPDIIGKNGSQRYPSNEIQELDRLVVQARAHTDRSGNFSPLIPVCELDNNLSHFVPPVYFDEYGNVIQDIAFAYTAGYFDGEGYVFLEKRRERKSTYRATFVVSDTVPASLLFVSNLVPSKKPLYATKRQSSRQKGLYRLCASSRTDSQYMFQNILPYAMVKRGRIEIALKFLQEYHSGETTHLDEYIQEVKDLNFHNRMRDHQDIKTLLASRLAFPSVFTER